MTITTTVSQLVDCEAAQAFDAFADPAKVTRFWLASASGPLSKGAQATWHFMVPGAVDTVTVEALERPSLIALTWSDGTRTRFEFSPHGEGRTKVSVAAEVSGREDLMANVINTTEGYAIVLCDLKAFVENGVSANLVKAKADLIASSAASGAGGS